MSVEQTRGRVDCGHGGVTKDASPERFRGLRIFDIGDPTRPVQVGQVQTCRGSHPHSVVSDPKARDAIIVRSAERSVGKGWVRTCRSGWAHEHKKKNTIIKLHS